MSSKNKSIPLSILAGTKFPLNLCTLSRIEKLLGNVIKNRKNCFKCVLISFTFCPFLFGKFIHFYKMLPACQIYDCQNAMYALGVCLVANEVELVVHPKSDFCKWVGYGG